MRSIQEPRLQPAQNSPIQRLATLIGESRAIVAFTGAGISTESGIPDFRSPGGVWSRHTPVMYKDFLNNESERRRAWQIRRETIPQFVAARPNAGHAALAAWEAAGRLKAIITQNIDELHQRAGSQRVVEIHGTAMRVGCLSCDARFDAMAIHTRVEAGDDCPACEHCGGILKSMTISFGQDLDPPTWDEAMALAKSCDLFVALGSSLVVYPAASLLKMAKARRAKLVIVNRDSTPLDGIADLVINAGIGETLSAVHFLS